MQVACLAIILLLLATSAALCWELVRPKGDTGTYLIPRGEMTAQEAQAMLDGQVASSRITVSLSPSMRLREDGSLRVNFLVEEPNNGFSERVEVEQGGRIIYASGVVAPGYGIEWCQAPEAHVGPAVATVYALDESGNDRGNPVSIELEIVDA